MKVHYRIPAKITGKKEINHCANAETLFDLIRLYLKAKKLKASAFFVYFE